MFLLKKTKCFSGGKHRLYFLVVAKRVKQRTMSENGEGGGAAAKAPDADQTPAESPHFFCATDYDWGELTQEVSNADAMQSKEEEEEESEGEKIRDTMLSLTERCLTKQDKELLVDTLLQECLTSAAEEERVRLRAMAHYGRLDLIRRVIGKEYRDKPSTCKNPELGQSCHSSSRFHTYKEVPTKQGHLLTKSMYQFERRCQYNKHFNTWLTENPDAFLTDEFVKKFVEMNATIYTGAAAEPTGQAAADSSVKKDDRKRKRK
jgi:hypothetical protein